MSSHDRSHVKPPIGRNKFLTVIALAITVLFYWLINDLFISLVLAAVMAALTDGLCTRLTKALRGRRSLAAGATVALCLIIVIVPLLLFFGVLVGQAVEVSESAGAWFVEEMGESGTLRQQLEENPEYKKLLPYQDEIVAKVGQLATKAGTYVAHGLAAGAKTTAALFLQLFILLFAMFSFLVYGRAFLEEVLRFTPLTATDRDRLLGIFASVGRATIKGTLVIGMVQGGLAGLSFWVAGVQGAVFWGAVMAVLSIIPGIGTALVWVPTAIFLALNGQTVEAAGIALWCAVVVGSADNLLRPLLIGKDIQMPDLLVMLTTLGGMVMFGPTGIIIGPIIGALYLTVWEIWGDAVDDACAAGEIAESNHGEGHGQD